MRGALGGPGRRPRHREEALREKPIAGVTSQGRVLGFGRLTRAGLAVPPGFVVGGAGYLDARVRVIRVASWWRPRSGKGR